MPCAPWAELPCSGGLISTPDRPSLTAHASLASYRRALARCQPPRRLAHILHVTFHALPSEALT